VFFTAVVSFQALVAVGVVLTGGPRTPLVCMGAVPVVMVATRFSRRGLIVGAPASGLVVLAATLGVDPGYVAAHPESVVVPLALVVCIALYMEPLLSSDVRHRADSTLDELTGLLNRRSLESRLAEVSQQAAMTGQPVSFVAGDLDHFKLVNDRWGHSVGDLVLSQAADTMRRRLRTFELLYRIGGEEFLLVLPGAGENDALTIAESLRAAVEAADPGGLGVMLLWGRHLTRSRRGARTAAQSVRHSAVRRQARRAQPCRALQPASLGSRVTARASPGATSTRPRLTMNGRTGNERLPLRSFAPPSRALCADAAAQRNGLVEKPQTRTGRLKTEVV
jgi:GGDEF domain-containing protein